MSFAIKPYIELCRVSNLPTIWTNVLSAVMLSGAGFSWLNFLILFLSMSFFYSGGMCLNDIYDKTIDTIKKPFRPIPSGRVSVKKAYILTISLFTTALSLLLIVPYQRAIYAGFLLLSAIVFYDKFHKVYSQSIILMATCRIMVFVVSAIAVSGKVRIFVIISGSLQFVYTLAISMVARYENNRRKQFPFPVTLFMIAGISLLDGIILALFASPIWFIAGISGALLTLLGQKYIRGD